MLDAAMGATETKPREEEANAKATRLAATLSSVSDTGAKWRGRLLWQALLVAVGVHVVMGIGAGLFIVLRHFTQPEAAFVSRPATILPPQIVDPKMAAAEFDAAATRPTLDKKLASVRPAEFALPDLPMMPFELDAEINVSDLAAAGVGEALAGGGGAGSGAGGGSMFGARKGRGMEGVFYDFKQDSANRVRRLDDGTYLDILRGFVGSGFSDRKLRRYFRASDSLFAPHIFMPTVTAEAAPQSFGVGDKVQARHWGAIYRARVTAPKSGKFRFVGLCDDILIVRFDGKVVLDGGIYALTPVSRSRGYVYPGVDGNQWYIDYGYHRGEYFRVEEGEIYPIEILLGEVPGGAFLAHLMIEEHGVEYAEDASGNPILPVFQVVAAPVPDGPQLPPVDRESPAVWPLASQPYSAEP
jgi:hypothetical protein